MNAKLDYNQSWVNVKKPLGRIEAQLGYGDTYDMKAYHSWLMREAKNPMTFRQFIDCLEAAYTGKAYATRNHWFFIVNGDELQFTKEECSRFARYFSEGFHMNLASYSKIIKAGGCYINERLFEDDEVFPLKANKPSYERWIIGKKVCDFSAKWVMSQEVTIAKIKADTIADEFYMSYAIEQESDLQAEMEMQRYG